MKVVIFNDFGKSFKSARLNAIVEVCFLFLLNCAPPFQSELQFEGYGGYVVLNVIKGRKKPLK